MKTKIKNFFKEVLTFIGIIYGCLLFISFAGLMNISQAGEKESILFLYVSLILWTPPALLSIGFGTFGLLEIFIEKIKLKRAK